MKFSVIKKGFAALGALALLAFSTGCGNTIYGLGLDMERAGQRLQRNRDPNPGTYPADGSGGSYYSQPTTPVYPQGTY